MWLEQTAVVGMDEPAAPVYRYLDSLDAFLIAAIQEVEELRHADLPTDQVEAELTAIWRRTYAFAGGQEEARLAGIWLARGRAIKVRYPDAIQRRRIYKTSLSPRSATRLIDLVDAVRARLQDGARYVQLEPEERFTFVHDILELLSQVPSFGIAEPPGPRRRRPNWPTLLRWWLAKPTLEVQPAPNEITSWYEFVSQNFIYRGTWGLGSILGLLLDTAEGDPIGALEIGDWPRSGLPWIAFWIKELITWGTLDPVAAFLLARGDAIDRPQAERDSRAYYDGLPQEMNPNDVLDPRIIRDWVDARRARVERPVPIREFRIQGTLERAVGDYVRPRLTVLPLETGDQIVWIDPAGYIVARSSRPREWPQDPSSFAFELSVATATIFAQLYLQHW